MASMRPSRLVFFLGADGDAAGEVDRGARETDESKKNQSRNFSSFKFTGQLQEIY